MKELALLVMLLAPVAALAQTAPAGPSDQWRSVAFLEGTWIANVSSGHGVSAAGTYVFQTELGGHILARHSTQEKGCSGPAAFDCNHGDLLYLYRDAPDQPLRAIYFDNEGHVIHYGVTTPSATTAVFQSDPGSAPQFRLTYQLKAGIMSGRFEVRTPGHDTWSSYLEWSGPSASPSP